MAQRILVLHGPNLNMLGKREPNIYGHLTLSEINQRLESLSVKLNVILNIYQSNIEGECVERIQATVEDGIDFMIINAAAFTHTSIAIRDAVATVALPFIEVHLSNIYKREPFRQHSYLSDLAIGIIAGLGISSYEAALRFAAQYEVISQ